MTELVSPVKLLTQPGCQSSVRVRDCLTMSGVPFVEHNIGTDPHVAQVRTETGIFLTPLVVAKGQALLITCRPKLARWLGFTCRCPDVSDAGS